MSFRRTTTVLVIKRLHLFIPDTLGEQNKPCELFILGPESLQILVDNRIIIGENVARTAVPVSWSFIFVRVLPRTWRHVHLSSPRLPKSSQQSYIAQVKRVVIAVTYTVSFF